MNLYDIADNYRELLEKIEDDKIPSEAIGDTIEAIEGEFSNKVDNIACMIKEMTYKAEALKQESAILTERKNTILNKIEALKDYLRLSLTKAGKTKIENKRSEVRVGKPSESVKITDIELLKDKKDVWKPYKYIEGNIDKIKLKDMLVNGEKVEGAKLEEGKNKLTIK